MVDQVAEYCRGLSSLETGIRRVSARALEQLGPEAVAGLSAIIREQDSAGQKDWQLLVGAVSAVSHLNAVNSDPVVRRYASDLTWLPEKEGRCDLHVHTNLSDGTLSVRELMQVAVGTCTKVLSICDHNTMDGVAAAQNMGEELGIRVVSGCEFSVHLDLGEARHPEWVEVHIAGYFLDPGSAEATDLMRRQQWRIQLRDIVAAREFLEENAERLRGAGKPTTVVQALAAANEHYADILAANGLSAEADGVRVAMRRVRETAVEQEARLQALLEPMTRSTQPYALSAGEESLLGELVLFSGYMLDHVMNDCFTAITKEEDRSGNWFSVLKKRQDHFVSFLPKIDAKEIVIGIDALGGTPVLSHPTWYPTLLLERGRRRLKATQGRAPTPDEDRQLKDQALSSGLRLVRAMHAIMPKGLQVMEFYHWSHDLELDLERPFLDLARELGASVTSASDCHGPKRRGQHATRMSTGADFNILCEHENIRILEGCR